MDNLFKKYNVLFNFYFAKDINKLINRDRHNQHFILLKQYAIYDLDIEFFKRFYQIDQSQHRIQLLANYFEKEKPLPFNTPNVVLTIGKYYIQKRKKRHKKLIMKLLQLYSQQNLQYESQFLASIKTEQLSNQQYQNKNVKSDVSYQTQPYNIFDQYTSQQQNQSDFKLKYQKCLLTILQNQENLKPKPIQQGDCANLICDFKDVDIDRIMNQYNSLQDNKKIRLNLKQLNKNLENSLDKKANQKFKKKVQEKEQRKEIMIQTNEGKIYFVKGPSKKMTNEKSNQNYDSIFKRKSEQFKQQNSSYEMNQEKFKKIKRLNFKSHDQRQFDQLFQGQRSTRISPQPNDIIKSGFLSDRYAPIQKSLKYLNIMDKLKIKNNKEEKNQQVQRKKTFQSPEQKQSQNNINRMKKIGKIRQKAAQLLNLNENKKITINNYKNSQFYSLNPHLRYN